MKHYTQLSQEQRYHISGLSKSGWNQAQIADEIGVNKSTIDDFTRIQAKQRAAWLASQTGTIHA